jgi:hypothetical protein
MVATDNPGDFCGGPVATAPPIGHHGVPLVEACDLDADRLAGRVERGQRGPEAAPGRVGEQRRAASGAQEGSNTMDDNEQVLQVFLDLFYLVFHDEWEYTRDRCTDPLFIAPAGTFVEPRVDDDSNNWANRGALLWAWRRLTAHVEWTPRSAELRLEDAVRAAGLQDTPEA